MPVRCGVGGFVAVSSTSMWQRQSRHVRPSPRRTTDDGGNGRRKISIWVLDIYDGVGDITAAAVFQLREPATPHQPGCFPRLPHQKTIARVRTRSAPLPLGQSAPALQDAVQSNRIAARLMEEYGTRACGCGRCIQRRGGCNPSISTSCAICDFFRALPCDSRSLLRTSWLLLVLSPVYSDIALDNSSDFGAVPALPEDLCSHRTSGRILPLFVEDGCFYALYV